MDIDKSSEVIVSRELLSDLPSNGGIVSITALDNDTIFALSEDMIFSNKNLLLYVFNTNKKIKLEIEKTGEYKPTHIALLASGDLLLLERNFSPIRGVSARNSLIKKPNVLSKETL